MQTEMLDTSDANTDGSENGALDVRWLSDSNLTEVQHVLFGYPLHFEQQPLSNHLGLTVWDASVVLAKIFEHQCNRKGALSSQAVKGKRVLELGSGMGLAGMAAAMAGGHVLLTDVAEVLPLLQRNVARNFETQRWSEQVGLRARFGSLHVQQLDWASPVAGGKDSTDYIIGADCIYHEVLVLDLLRVVLHFCSHKTVVVFSNEFRSEAVQRAFEVAFGGYFVIKRMPCKWHHPQFRSEHVHVLLCQLKNRPNPDAVAPGNEAAHRGRPGPL